MSNGALNQDTALLAAVQACDTDAIAAALAEGANPNYFTVSVNPVYLWENTKSLLEYAVEKGCLTAIKLLVEHGATVEQEPPKDFLLGRRRPSMDGQMGLYPLNTVRTDLDPPRTEPQNPFDGNLLLFLWSLSFGRTEVSDLLFNLFVAKAPRETVDHLLAEALFFLIEAQSPEVVRYVISKMDQPGRTLTSAKTILDISPLKWACIFGSLGVVKVLVESGADVNQWDRHGTTALMTALYYGHEDIALYLLGQGADVDAVGLRRMTALSQAKKMKLKRAEAAIEAKLKGSAAG